MPRREALPPVNFDQFDASHMSIQERREIVAELYMKGYLKSWIARGLHLSPTTVANDIEAIEVELHKQRLPNIARSYNRALYSLRLVLSEAWSVYGQLSPEKQNKIGALQTILQVEQQMQKLEGLAAPDSLNSAALAEAQDTLIRVLERIGGPDLVRVYLSELGVESGTSLGAYLSSQLRPAPALSAPPAEIDVHPDDDAPTREQAPQARDEEVGEIGLEAYLDAPSRGEPGSSIVAEKDAPDAEHQPEKPDVGDW